MATFTKQHFEVLAAVMKSTRPINDGPLAEAAFIQWKSIVRTLTIQLQLNSMRFDLMKFLKACGVKDDD